MINRMLRVLGFLLLVVTAVFGQAQLLTPDERVSNGLPPFSFARFRLHTPYPGPSFTSKVIEIEGSLFSSHRRVQVYHSYASNGTVPGTVQEWLIVPAGRFGATMTYNIVNIEFSHYLDAVIENGSVRAIPGNGSLSQRWMIRANSSSAGSFSLTSLVSGQAFTFPSSADGSACTLTNFNNSAAQSLRIISLISGPNVGQTHTWNVTNPKLIRTVPNQNQVIAVYGAATADDSVMGLWQRYNGIADQEYIFYYTAPDPNQPTHGKLDYYRIFERNSYGVLGLAGTSTGVGAFISRRNYVAASDTQNWYVMKTKVEDEFLIVNAATGLVVEPQNGQSGNGTRLVQNFITGNSNQRWKFTAP